MTLKEAFNNCSLRGMDQPVAVLTPIASGKGNKHYATVNLQGRGGFRNSAFSLEWSNNLELWSSLPLEN